MPVEPVVQVGSPLADAADVTPERPADSALKDAWVDYAAAVGWDRDDAEAATKDDLKQNTA